MINLKKKKGFTLVELVMVILIIAILAVALVPQLSSMVNKAKGSGVTEDFHEFQTAAQAVLYENSGIPAEPGTTTNGAVLVEALNKNLDAANKIVKTAGTDEVVDTAASFDSNGAFTKTLDPWNKNYKVVKIAAAGDHKGGVAFITGGPNATIATTGVTVAAGVGTLTAADVDDQATFIIYTNEGSVTVGTVGN